MSLINQALRKAQRDRTPERMSTGDSMSGGPENHKIQAAFGGSGFSPALMVGLALAVALLIGLVVGLSIVLFTGDSNAGTVTSSAPALGSTATTSPAASEPAAPQITPPTRAQTTPETATPNVLEELRRAREATEAKAQAEAQAAVEPAAAGPEARAEVEPNQAIIDWLRGSKISGVRLAGVDSRVILNGEAFSVGELVNFSLELKVVVIQESRVLFEDGNGKKYMKRL